MPIRINLKELFSADDQAITVDKINFNFNKLLDLGIGDQGKRGFSGIEGAAGPVGIIGPEGIRGNAWFVDIGDPGAPSTFPDLLPGDFYLDSQSFAVWQYNGTGWDFLFNLTSIIDNYLSASPSPFNRGLGIGSPNDDRFIVFNRRDDALFDVTRKSDSTNDILFLCNFDEDTLAAAVNGFDYGPIYPNSLGTNIGTKDLYTSLLSIYMNHTGISGALDTFGRYAIELGSLYSDGTDPKLTQINENFKMKFSRITPSLQVAANHYNIAQFSLDVPSGEASSVRSVNSAFQFISSKYDGSLLKEGVEVFIGSQYALDELVGTVNTVKSDGLLFRNIRESFLNANIGLANDFEINLGDFPLETGYVTNAGTESYLLLDAGAGVAAILADRPVYQDGGNIIQLATTQPRKVNEEISDYGAPLAHRGHIGIASHGNTIYTVSGVPYPVNIFGAVYGYFNKFTIENPNNPISEFQLAYSRFDGRTAGGTSAPCQNTYNGATQPFGPGASDIAIAGEYAYVVNGLNGDIINSDASHEKTYFQVLKLNSFNYTGLEKVSRLGEGEMAGSTLGTTEPGELDSSYRIKIKGNYAIVARNALYINALRTYLGFPGIYDGGIASIDISDPTAPYIESTANEYLTTPYDKSAMLDMEIINDIAVCLSWRQTLDNNCDWEVRVSTFRVDQPTSLEWLGQGASSLDNGNVTAPGTYAALSKRGAITANEKYIYAGYGDTVQILNLARPSIGLDRFGQCMHTYAVLQTITLVFPGGENNPEILDIKQFGNSLYVLATTGNSRFNSYVFKLDISGGFDNTATSSPTSVTQVYRKDLVLTSIAGRFTIIGKHMYVATVEDTSTTTNATTLVAVDFDGIYSGGAHIESLRADQLDVTRDANIGGSLNVRSDTNIGGNLKVDGSISFGGGIDVPGLVPVGVVVPFAGTAAPAGWFICDGTLKSKTLYSDLYAALDNGTLYGESGGQFRVPDLRVRVPVGFKSGDPRVSPVGFTGGATGTSLAIGNLPRHTHNAIGDGATINIASSGPHFHQVTAAYIGGSGHNTGNASTDFGNTTLTTTAGANYTGAHVHPNSGFTGTVGNGATQGMLATPTPFSVMQPYIAMNYIIYTGVGG